MVPPGIVDVAPWPDWPAAVDGALRALQEHLGWDVWAVTRIDGDHQYILRAHPTSAITPGMPLSWSQSFCRQMLAGNAPRVATVTAAVPAYARCSAGLLTGVAAYMGVPLVTPDLQLFGTLCAVSFRAQPRSAARRLPLVELVARLLSTLLAAPSGRVPTVPTPRRPVPIT
jgi:GAF domain-containing protein